MVRVECVWSNRYAITWRFWSTSRLAMLAAKADFPTPGDPLIQIILGLLMFLISCSISCKKAVRVPSIHDLRRGSLFSPRVLTKSSSSLSATVFTFFVIVADSNHKSVRLNNEYQAQKSYLALLGSLDPSQNFSRKHPVSSAIQ